MTYRDAQTYDNVVSKAPLYPLNSLMLHGIIYAKNASHLTNMSDADFADQAREFFGNGTQLQEMYITPALLDKQNWDDLAEAAKWSRAERRRAGGHPLDWRRSRQGRSLWLGVLVAAQSHFGAAQSHGSAGEFHGGCRQLV